MRIEEAQEAVAYGLLIRIPQLSGVCGGESCVYESNETRWIRGARADHTVCLNTLL